VTNTDIRATVGLPAEGTPVRSSIAPWHAGAALALLLLTLGGLHVWWLVRFRRGFPLDIDESGYLWFSIELHDALREDGPLAVLRGFQHEGWVGPLLPAVTAFAQLPGGAREIVPSIAVQLLFLAVLAVSSYGIGAWLLDRRAGLLTAFVTSTAPALLDFVRTYHLVLPSTAMYALATYALLGSDRLRRRSWSIGWGVALGLTMLSRSMVIAFAPALVLAAAWMLVVDRAERRRILNLGLGLAAFAATTLLWYGTSWRPIFRYLLDFGYGSATPGDARTPLSLAYWTDELRGALEVSVYLPLAGVLAAALVAGCGALAIALARSRNPVATLSNWLRRAARSDAVVPAFVVGEGYIALTSSGNDGTGFVVPLLPSFFALTCITALRVPWQLVRRGLVGALCAASVFNVVMKADVLDPVSEARTVEVPLIGRAPLTNGRGFLHQHLVNEACYDLGPPTDWLPDRERGWLVLFREAVSSLDTLEIPDREPRTYVALEEPVLNASSIRLASLRYGRKGGVFDYVRTGSDGMAAYRRFLAEMQPDLLLTASAEACHFGPQVTQRRVEAAAASLGYVARRKLPMPDGRMLHVWTHPVRETS
jgi:hypothetical protein